MEERRQYPRMTCLISAHVRKGTKIYEGTVTNLCEDGCFVISSAPFDEDAPIQLRFRHPRTDTVVKSRAVVQRRVKPGEGRMGLGLTLVDTLSALEPSAGATVSSSGTWSRPELATRSGTWATFDAGGSTDRITSTGPSDTTHQKIVDRRGMSTEDTARTDAGRRRVKIELSGGAPVMGLLDNISEGGFSASAEPCPPLGKLFRMSFSYDGRNVELAAKVTWRADAQGGLRGFGAIILKFAGKQDHLAWNDLLEDLRA